MELSIGRWFKSGSTECISSVAFRLVPSGVHNIFIYYHLCTCVIIIMICLRSFRAKSGFGKTILTIQRVMPFRHYTNGNDQ